MEKAAFKGNGKVMAHNKATQIGPKLAVTFLANSATNVPSNFGRWFWRYKPKD
jgi:hypothetical protein